METNVATTVQAMIVYHFGLGKTNGAGLKADVLGGKGFGLMEMASIDGVPVPPGFIIPTTECKPYLERGYMIDQQKELIREYVGKVGEKVGRTFGDSNNPLLLSSRSGAAVSMPGMLKTILNVGTSRATIPGLIEQFNNERFAWDCYRRLIDMWGETVMNIDHEVFEHAFAQYKNDHNIASDHDMAAKDMEQLCAIYEEVFEENAGMPFPQDVWDQLFPAVEAVFKSWYGQKAIDYRKIEKLDDLLGTAVVVMAMVFGNLNERSGTGVLFTRNPSTGVDELYGEVLFNAQGEDVVAGIRTPEPISVLKERMPEVYEQLLTIVKSLERSRQDIQDIEFTIEDGQLFMLQTRNGKRNGTAAFEIAVAMVNEGLVTKERAITKLIAPDHVLQMLLPRFNELTMNEYREAKAVIAKGLAASPGAASGMVVFDKETAVRLASEGHKVILVRRETSPEDIKGMWVSQAVLTVVGGLSSHAGVVMRGWGKPCIVGAGAISINLAERLFTVGEHTVREGDVISVNSTTGEVILGEHELSPAEQTDAFREVMSWAMSLKRMGVRANAETPEDARRAREFGAEGISLFRTEHMFYGEDGAESLYMMKKLILSTSPDEANDALGKLLPAFKRSFYNTLVEMNGLPVTVRELDPPRHEFVSFAKPSNHEEAVAQMNEKVRLANDLGITLDELERRIESLHEVNPGSGLRGSRLGVMFPDIARAQIKALCETIVELRAAGYDPHVEIEVPFVFNTKEYENQISIVHEVASEYNLVAEKDYLVGPMMECTAACLDGTNLARPSQFASFGSNDLTSSVMNISRDDASTFLPFYVEKKILPTDPFQTINPLVLEMMHIGVKRLRAEKGADIQIGVCGEHGGDPKSIYEFDKIGLDYVGCSPFRIPVAIFAAAQSAIRLREQQDAAKN